MKSKTDRYFEFSFTISVSKNLLKQMLLMIILAAIFFGVSFYNKPDVQKQAQSISLPKKQINIELPVRLKIPKINVDAAIQHVGVTAENLMDVPSNIVDVGWFKVGPKPGEKGSAVIDGHVDGQNGEEGVFGNLHKLTKGDNLYVQDDKGKSLSFIVRDTRIYDEGEYASDVFGQGEGIHLNLITCDGVWDGVKKTYTKRLVVFADIEPVKIQNTSY